MSKRKAIPRLARAAAAGALGLAAAGGLAAFAGPASAADLPGTAGAAPPAVFVQTDNPAGNQVIAFAQQPAGQLSQEQVVSTGGLGGAEAGANNLASQGSLTYDPGHHLLFAVNAGSDTISVLSVEGRHVRLDQVLSSGGEFPNSIAVHGNLVYVANAGGAGSVSGFSILGQHVVPIPGSARSLGLDDTNPSNFHTGPGQVIFSPNGSELLVNTKEATNSIDVFQVGPAGYLSAAPAVTPDNSSGPFAFAFTPSGQLVVAEVAIAALHTFAFGPHGTLTSLAASVPDGQVAQCWVIAADGFYYVANAGSADLSEYTVAADGTPSLVAAVAAQTGTGSIDLTASADGKYIYAEAGAGGGTVFELRINSDGSLSPIGSVPGLGADIEGIAAG
ncbi:MAG TPA: beta-propeller fold lactonase family protein [Streptosporangiaceae bacterium]|nr:beta-propeller fold lactonase family protein [Streptosporangiaceae bacterium]